MEQEEQNERDKRRYRKQIIIVSTFLIASIVWFWIALSKTTKDSNRVRSWVEVPCLIKDVKIDVDHISSIANFFWVISYAYEYDGRQFTSSRYNIVEKNKVIGGKEKRAIIEARKAGRRVEEPYSVGDESVCFVNPRIRASRFLFVRLELWRLFLNVCLAQELWWLPSHLCFCAQFGDYD